MNKNSVLSNLQKQPSRGVRKKRRSENVQQIYRRTHMPKCDFNELLCSFIEITLRHGSSPEDLLHIFRTSFSKNTSGWLLLNLLITLILIKLYNFQFYTRQEQLYQKEIPTQIFCCEICEIFKNTCFKEHQRTNPSALLNEGNWVKATLSDETY